MDDREEAADVIGWESGAAEDACRGGCCCASDLRTEPSFLLHAESWKTSSGGTKSTE